MKSKGQADLLCLDIGNTSSGYGLFRRRSLISAGCVPSWDIPLQITKLIKNCGPIPDLNIVISSVVPKITQSVLKRLKRHLRTKVWVLGRNLRVQLKHNYIHINQLGQDRLVDAYGAVDKYGTPVLIMDFGTAVTCDYVDSRGVFRGGLIIPGPGIALDALCRRTALLPRIPFPRRSKRKPLVGRSTRTCMEAGILQAYGAMTDGLVARFRRLYGKSINVVATGGYAEAIAPYTREVRFVDPLLTVRSLARIFWNQSVSVRA